MRKTFIVLVLMYGVIFGSLFYWQLCGDLHNHPANPRYYAMFKTDRGVIFDRSGIPLATSMEDGEVYTRRYAATSLSHVLGYFHQRYGMTGLERLYHEDLSMGRSMITTLDLGLQKTAEDAMQGKTGAIVVVRPATGEILALVSSPMVDGNVLDDNWPDYLVDKRSPFMNRVTHGLYPPGSVVKPIVYAAALQDGLVDDKQVWQDDGVLILQNRTISNSGGRAHGRITTDEALALSSNVVFAQLAIALGDRLLDAYELFGLGHEIRFELQSLGGFVPAKVASDYDAAQLGIGQGSILVTPLQMALVASSIANGGEMMQPYVVQELRGGLKMRQITRPRVAGQVMPSSIARDLQEAMVLAAREGTAQSRVSGGVSYGGKTGTAQTGHGGDHAWFIGFAPAESPTVAVAVLVEQGGSGSEVAVPIGVTVLREALGIDE